MSIAITIIAETQSNMFYQTTTTIQIVFLPFMFYYAKGMGFESAKMTKLLDCCSVHQKGFHRNGMLNQRRTTLLEKPELNVCKICDMQSVNAGLEVQFKLP